MKKQYAERLAEMGINMTAGEMKGMESKTVRVHGEVQAYSISIRGGRNICPHLNQEKASAFIDVVLGDKWRDIEQLAEGEHYTVEFKRGIISELDGGIVWFAKVGQGLIVAGISCDLEGPGRQK